ncbi:MAG: NAD(P)/FAD-dependent oxidoreductase, partial [Thermoanaerobaculia bacterium]
IVGGGVAGLTAAIHLGWHDRRALVIDRRSGPLQFTVEKLYNVPGMPATRGIDILKQLRAQAESLGAEVVKGNVLEATGEDGDFVLRGEKDEEWRAEKLLLATGVARYHPTVDGDYRPCFKYAGKGNLYYCPDCEAPEIRGKSTLVIGVGPPDWASGMAVGLSRYTSDLRILQTAEGELSDESAAALERRGIAHTTGTIAELVGEKGRLSALRLDDGRTMEAEAFFVSSPAIGRTDLATQLGVEMAHTGRHAQPASQRGDTNVPGVWIAGDLRPMTQQVSVAMGTGNIAAVMIDQSLRKQDVQS